MLADQSQNLPPVLEITKAAYGGSIAQLPPEDRDRLAHRAGNLASCVRFGLDEPEAMRRLRGVAAELHDVPTAPQAAR
jgi:hypothetical protein